MNIELNLDRSFVECLNKLKNKYNEKFEKMNGFHNNNLNFTDFIDKFIDHDTVADATIDGNANSSNKDVKTLINDMVKPHTKLLAYNKIFYEMKKKYGSNEAKKWLENEWNGAFYLHNAPTSTYTPYCFAYDLDLLVEKGLFFIDKFKAKPAKHLTTFNDHVLEFISWNANRTSGAVGLPSYLVYSYYFWYNDIENNFLLRDKEYYREQCFQKFIYDLNQPYLRVTECAFTNITIMDREYLIGLFGDRKFPNGEYIVDHIEGIIEHQKSFMKTLAKIREEQYMTFPVLTYSLLYQNGKFVDKKFAKFCNKHNLLWYDSNFFVGNDVSVLSNCCFSKDQEVLIKSGENVHHTTFENLDSFHNKQIDIYHKGGWVKGKIVKLPKRQMYEIVTESNQKICVTDNHINPTLNGDIKTSELTTDNYLLENTKILESKPKTTDLTYEEGFLIGAYIKHGYSYQKTRNGVPLITIFLGKDEHNNFVSVFKKAIKMHDDCQIFFKKDHTSNRYYIEMNSFKLENFIKKWTKNSSESTWVNPNCLLESFWFRHGILDGLRMKDDKKSSKIVTDSYETVKNLECLINSLGRGSRISSHTKDSGIEYSIKWYVRCDSSSATKIKSIKKIDYEHDYVYCFEIKNQKEPYFTLPNGIITHNCRLLSDTKNVKLSGFINSIGGTSLKIGSVQVNTINLRRIALESNRNKEKYIEILKERLDNCIRVLDVLRNIIARNVEKGLLPNYKHRLIEMERQYNTIGLTAMYEAIREFGLIETDEFGNKSYSEEGLQFAIEILDVVNETKDNFESDYSINVEFVPGERCNVVVCDKDSELYGNNHNDFIYSNQWIPLMEKCTINEKIKLGSILDKKCGGGQISHINLQGRFSNEEQSWELLNHIASKGVIYFAYNVETCTCEEGHGFFGDTCPICGKPVYDTWSRIVGFLVGKRAYSKERKKEYENRQWFKL